MDTQGSTIAVIDTDASWGMTVKVLVGFLIGLLVGIGGTWLVTRNHGASDETINGATSTPVTGTITGGTTSGSGSVTSSGGSSLVPNGDFSVVDQSAGMTVAIDKVAFGQGGGWVVVHEDDNGGLGHVLGAAWFAEGSWNGTVELLRGTEAGKTYHAVLYGDAGSDKQFSLADDKPLLSQVDQKMVEQTFTAK